MNNILFLTRHGETQESLDLIVQGQSNSLLTENGKRLSRSLGCFLNTKYSITKIYTSDLIRAFDTAVIVASIINPAPNITIEPSLREVSCGTFEKRPFKELDHFRSTDPKGINNARPIGGESLNDMRNRVLSWFSSYLLSSENGALIVTHKGPLTVLCEHSINSNKFNINSLNINYNILIILEVYSGLKYKICEIIDPQNFIFENS